MAPPALRLAANVSMLFTERPFLDRFAAAAGAGFPAAECQFPYAWPAPELAARLAEAGIPLVLLNLPAGDWERGERGIAALPGREAEFREGVERAVEWACATGCRQANALAGIPPPGLPPAEARRLLEENLRAAARRLARWGMRLLVEPINTRDVPGFLLSRADDAVALLDEVGEPNAALQLDAYHAASMGDDPAALVARHGPRIGHVQIADAPGRHEPGTGAIDFPALLAALRGSGYVGWLGCEYRPAAATEAGLGWMARFR